MESSSSTTSSNSSSASNKREEDSTIVIVEKSVALNSSRHSSRCNEKKKPSSDVAVPISAPVVVAAPAQPNSSNENFQMIQKSEIINFNKLNQLNGSATNPNPNSNNNNNSSNAQTQTQTQQSHGDMQKHVNFLLTSKRRERERDDAELLNADVVKMHRRR